MQIFNRLQMILLLISSLLFLGHTTKTSPGSTIRDTTIKFKQSLLQEQKQILFDIVKTHDLLLRDAAITSSVCPGLRNTIERCIVSVTDFETQIVEIGKRIDDVQTAQPVPNFDRTFISVLKDTQTTIVNLGHRCTQPLEDGLRGCVDLLENLSVRCRNQQLTLHAPNGTAATNFLTRAG
ncbi:uncharacterized protein LTR77_000085 [Saxophila tyrrhenica]|uniref:Secreted protein n=1 Tax=Saxophila tyrrhenica TaxID=1690608 RepID=A0AAV9PLQ3_9PEZI|nr:hypothetical protein LTR77_000085 [Saxophila tyrrhenica]